MAGDQSLYGHPTDNAVRRIGEEIRLWESRHNRPFVIEQVDVRLSADARALIFDVWHLSGERLVVADTIDEVAFDFDAFDRRRYGIAIEVIVGRAQDDPHG